MATVKRTTPTRVKSAPTKTVTELTESMAALDARIAELTAQQNAFLQNSYVSQKVHHKTYGEGIITEQKEDIIKVSFAESGLTKAFVIHRKFTNRPVFEDDEKAITAFTEFADLRQTINQLKQKRIHMEKQRAVLTLSNT